MESSSGIRRPFFIAQDDGLASLADMEAVFSGNHQSSTHHRNHHNHPFFSRFLCYGRRGSFRNLSSFSSSPRSAKSYDARFEDQQPHFLKSCFLCEKPLGDNRDIFMYRGDTPFCSEECRQEQIERDEAKDKNWNLSSSMKALRKKEQKRSSLFPTKAPKYPSHTGTVAAA